VKPLGQIRLMSIPSGNETGIETSIRLVFQVMDEAENTHMWLKQK
jgi:hypothetical protein